jgi:hypothetical protein
MDQTSHKMLTSWSGEGTSDKLVFPHISVMARQFLAIPAASVTAERVFSFAGLTLSDLRKSLLEGTLEATKWGSPSIPLGRGDLHITHPELCE